MSDHITDDMVDAADAVFASLNWDDMDGDRRSDVAQALVAAVAAMPTVDGAVYCREWDRAFVRIQTTGQYPCETYPGLREFGDCPGPHRRLHIGAEVDA